MNTKFATLAYICIQIMNLSNFYPLEVVARGREAQLQVGKNLNSIAYF